MLGAEASSSVLLLKPPERSQGSVFVTNAVGHQQIRHNTTLLTERWSDPCCPVVTHWLCELDAAIQVLRHEA